MSNMRVTDEQLTQILDSMWADRNTRGTLKWQIAADLRDARARILELERLSASQEEAMAMMERGAL